uniref:Uncharacterized protein n=1 Tax=Arundo donax TaxID=35708 RepID=A0A0A8XYC4_ARUDO
MSISGSFFCSAHNEFSISNIYLHLLSLANSCEFINANQILPMLDLFSPKRGNLLGALPHATYVCSLFSSKNKLLGARLSWKSLLVMFLASFASSAPEPPPPSGVTGQDY